MTMTSSEVKRELELFEFAPGKRASFGTLRHMLPDVGTALFFAKAFKLDYRQLSDLIYTLFKSNVIDALSEGNHSVDLQDYLIDVVPDAEWVAADIQLEEDIPHAEILPEVWESISITIAKSIADVAEKLGSVIEKMPSKEGQMAFNHLRKLNRQRPTIGDYRAVIHHQAVEENLVVLDDSGSMTESTIERILPDVIAMSWKANATLALVSNTTRVWAPGTYGLDDVLASAQYGGTHYESLKDLFQRDWGTVVSIADYDSSMSAKTELAKCTGRIGALYDISLVNQPSFLAECLGQLADTVEPLLIARSYMPLSA